MDLNLYELAGLGICFLAMAYFSLVETALTSLTPTQAERLSKSKNWFKRSLQYWITQPHQLLASILLGSTLATTAAAMLSKEFTEDRYGSQNIWVLTLIVSILVLIFGEIGPKMLARSYAEAIAPYACRLLVFFNIIFYPVTSIITKIISVLLRTFGLIMSTKRVILPQDIEQMVLLAGREGSIERDKTKILSSVFQFSKRRVKDIMIPRDRISSISIDAGLMSVLDIVRQENHSRYPVYNKDLDRVVGFLHVRDLFAIVRAYGFSGATQQQIDNFSLRTCLRRAFFVSDQALINRVLNEMKTNRIHLAIVKDEWGNVVGLITLEDILEEIFGEIEDEHDEARMQPVVDLYSTGIEVDGDMRLVDLKSQFGVEIEPGESYSTVNGFLQHYAPHQQLTPKTVVIWKSYVLSILTVKDGAVEKVRITEVPAHTDREEAV